MSEIDLGELLMDVVARHEPKAVEGPSGGWLVVLPLGPEMVNQDDAKAEAYRWADRLDTAFFRSMD